MLRLAFLFLVIAFVAALFGFTTIAGASLAIAKVLAFVFLAIFLILLVTATSVARRIGKAK